MLLNNGRHPTTNVTVIPADVVEHVALGVSVSLKKAEYPETVANFISYFIFLFSRLLFIL